MQCLKCRREREFQADKFCQTCEGKYEAVKVADTINFEVNKIIEQKNLDPGSYLYKIFREKIRTRWINTHLRYIKADQFPKFIDAFIKAVNELTENINVFLPPRSDSNN